MFKILVIRKIGSSWTFPKHLIVPHQHRFLQKLHHNGVGGNIIKWIVYLLWSCDQSNQACGRRNDNFRRFMGVQLAPKCCRSSLCRVFSLVWLPKGNLEDKLMHKCSKWCLLALMFIMPAFSIGNLMGQA